MDYMKNRMARSAGSGINWLLPMNLTRRHLLNSSFGLLASTRLPAAPGRGLAQFDPQVDRLLPTMTLDEKIGQMTQPDQSYLKKLDDIERFHLGSILSGGDSDPKSGNDLNSWTDLYDQYQSRALAAKPRIPLLYGVDAVHGHNNVIGAVIFPHNIGLGCTRDAPLVERAARITAEEVRATGIQWAFAPSVTVPQDVRWGRSYEGFSEAPDVVQLLGAAAVRGLQGKSLDDPLSVAACAKHFVGDGGTRFGTGLEKLSDQGDTRVDEATLRKIHLPGYITAIQAGVATIMPSYSSWSGLKCSGHRKLLTEILKKELGFSGFLISDYNALDELPGNHRQQIAQSINAGMDMVMVPERYEEFFHTLRELVDKGEVPIERINDAVTRVLRVKFAMGLMDPNRRQLADRGLHKTFGSAEHRAVARECVRQSLVLLKNEKRVLPLAKNAVRIHVAGKSADDLGNQCGGWTITWQGKSGAPTQGTTILAAIRKSGAQVTHSADGSGAAGASVGIAVIGETPYAEMQGDRASLAVAGEDVAVVDRMKSAGIPVIVLLISGRPLLIESVLQKADAVIAAWLPGSEGDGVADVLFGEHKPSGKLSFTWPSRDTTTFARGDPGYKSLFGFGYGLSY
jgi:beta-glucosidase